MSINHQARWQKPTATTASATGWRHRWQRAGALVCLMVAMGLLAVGKYAPAPTQAARMEGGAWLASAAHALSHPLTLLATTFEDWDALRTAHDRNRVLSLELQNQPHMKARLLQLEAENKALRAALPLAPAPRQFFIAAHVMARGGDGQQQLLWINAGRADGVRDDYAVMSPEGVIGRVLEAGAHHARVLLMTDAQSRLPVVLGRTRFHAIAAGQSSGGMLALRYVPTHATPEPGEMVLTAGDGQVIPAGLPVGVVEAGPADQWLVRPLADFSRLDYVTIVDFSWHRDTPSSSSFSSQ